MSIIRQLFSMRVDSYTRWRFMVAFITVSVLFLLFYWTNIIVDSKKAAFNDETLRLQERIATVRQLSAQIENNRRDVKRLTTGLLSYVQELGTRSGTSLINIRLVSSTEQQEQISFRAEDLVYQELITLLRDIEAYDNIWVKSLTVNKRFDNPMRIDVACDLVRN